MKFLLVICATVLCLYAMRTFADSDTATQINNGTSRNRHGARQNTGASPKPSVKNKLAGECLVIAGNGNVVTAPCSNLVLTLTVGGDKGILYGRTDAGGVFEFNNLSDDKYKIGVTSRFYEVVSPTEDLHPGQKVNLQLRQK